MAATQDKPAQPRRDNKDHQKHAKAGDPPGRERPSVDEMRARVAKLNDRINDLKEQQRRLNDKQGKDKDVGSGVREARRKIQDVMNGLHADLKGKAAQRQELQKRIREIDEEKTQLRASIGKEVAGFESADAVAREIKRLEYIMETSSTPSLKKERKMMEKIRELEHSKHTVKDRENRLAELTKRDTERKELLDSVKKLQAEIEAVRGEIDGHRGQLDGLQPKAEVTEAQSASRQEYVRLGNEIQQAHKEIQKTKADFQQALDDYQEWLKEERVRRQKERDEREKAREERIKKFQEERQKKDQEGRKAKREEERIRRLNPKEDEIDTCTQLIGYLLALEGQQARQSEAQVVEFDPTQTAVKPGLVALPKKGAEDEWLFMDRSKRKEKAAKKPEAPQAAEKKDKRLHLHMVKVQGFSHVGVPAPQFLSQIEETVAKLREKKAHFETFRRTQAEVDAELAVEEAEEAALLAQKLAAKQQVADDADQADADAQE